jgi:hypothetical protein
MSHTDTFFRVPLSLLVQIVLGIDRYTYDRVDVLSHVLGLRTAMIVIGTLDRVQQVFR